MLLWTIIGELIFWSPVIVTGILALFNPWWWTAVSLIIAFWAGPFTPAIPLQIALIYALNKTYQKIKAKCRQKQENKNKYFDESGKWIYKGDK